MTLTKDEVLSWLCENNEEQLENLWNKADIVRQQHVGDEIYLRGLLEISNHCERLCHYCGLNASNRCLSRYRMDKEDILEAAQKVKDFGYGTVVLQAGEDSAITKHWMAELIRELKALELAVTLSLGERSQDELALWKSAGADRYLLRFETSDTELLARIHPPKKNGRSRIEILSELKELGYEVGSGVMVGIPGQTTKTLAEDIWLFKDLELDMIGVGPFIPHPDTRLARSTHSLLENEDQVPNSEEMVYKVLALTRILCPETNIPSTTALATLNPENGRELALQRGANIIMPNVTPKKFSESYEIYQNKAGSKSSPEESDQAVKATIEALGRTLGKGPGASPKYKPSRNHF